MCVFIRNIFFCGAAFCLLWLLPAQTTALADDREKEIRVELASSASFPLFAEVTVLPLRFADNRSAPELTRIFIEILDATLKYRLRQPKAGENIPPFLPGSDPESTLKASIRQFATDARQQAVIGGMLVAEQIGNEGRGRAADGTHRLILHLFDLHEQQTVWSLAYNVDVKDPQELARQRTQRAVDVLLDELVRRGDIFTPRLPAPVILSRKMVDGQARVVLLGEHQAGIAAYRLMRAEAIDAPFVPIGRDVANTRHSVVLEDRRTPAYTGGWYTVVGLDDRGLAGVPESPFYIADPAATPP